jgi:enoyl-CoA hydratase/carnithine racemase
MQVAGYWRVSLNHPPINTVDDLMYDEMFDLVQAMDAEPALRVVTFESANLDYFLAHHGSANRGAASAHLAGLRPRSNWFIATSSASRWFVEERAGRERVRPRV